MLLSSSNFSANFRGSKLSATVRARKSLPIRLLQELKDIQIVSLNISNIHALDIELDLSNLLLEREDLPHVVGGNI